MSGMPAARVGDFHLCPMVTPAPIPVPHVGGVIQGPGALTVLIGGMCAARIGDMGICVSPAPNPIVKGAFPVAIQGSPASRVTDSLSHGGLIISGDLTVLIGLAGTAGNTVVGTAMCEAAKNGRTGHANGQSYNNCGVESSRQLINQATGSNLNENGLLQSAIDAGLANGTPGSPPVFANGGTVPEQRQAILARNGVPSTVVTNTPDAMGTALSQGRGVLVDLDAADLWGPPQRAGSWHVVTVTGVEYDDAGNRVAVIINDTGIGTCGQRIPADQFDRATGALARAGFMPSALNITSNPIY